MGRPEDLGAPGRLGSRCRPRFRRALRRFCGFGGRLDFGPLLPRPIAVADDRYDVRVVNEAVENGCRQDWIGEHFAPLLEGLVARYDDRAALVPLGDHAEDVIGDDLVEWSKACLLYTSRCV